MIYCIFKHLTSHFKRVNVKRLIFLNPDAVIIDFIDNRSQTATMSLPGRTDSQTINQRDSNSKPYRTKHELGPSVVKGKLTQINKTIK